MLALGIHYLTGYATATSVGSRDEAEWPPHPGRVFMALVAALYETKPHPGDTDSASLWQEEHTALEWLEALEAPSLKVSEHFDKRAVVTSYVPVNDKLSLPANKQPRTFPKVRPHDPNVFLVWPDATPSNSHKNALQRLCGKVTRIGHSSSLVQMWRVPEGEEPAPDLHPVATPSRGSKAVHLRIPTAGCLRELQQQFNGDAIDRFFDLSVRISSSRGKAKREAEATFAAEFGTKWTRSLPPPTRLRPMLTITRPYVRSRPAAAVISHGCFDSDLLILAKQDGPNLGLESTAALTDALRGALLKSCGEDAPEWLTGHRARGVPSERTHAALLALAFAGFPHADGHLLGLAIAFPRDLPARERGRVLRPFLYDQDGLPAEIRLTLGKLGVWTLRQEERTVPPLTLRPETWCQTAEPTDTWASVTPVVLNRHPKLDPYPDRAAWFAEISDIIATSCEHSGLPRPVEIDLDKTSWHEGAPRARPGAGGFPLLLGKPSAPARQQIHVWLRFANPVQGPARAGESTEKGRTGWKEKGR
ncbi:CRISPR-associated protein [Opitutaceae bacterium TAV5]|nr:CRISPR-associated protein [Opitutaceae bacterium TAV5]